MSWKELLIFGKKQQSMLEYSYLPNNYMHGFLSSIPPSTHTHAHKHTPENALK